MASITRKTIGGNTYYYARECKRVNGRPKIVWQKYLGRLDDIIAAVTERRAGVAPATGDSEGWTVELGAVAPLYDLCRRLDLAGTIDRVVPKRGKGPSVGTYLLVATINRCVAPCSKASIAEWFESTVLRRLVDITPKQLTSQRYWDNMNRVSEEAIAAIEAELTQRAVEEFELDLSRILFDATNFFTFIDSFNDRCTIAKRGKSKEGRAALRIVGLALLVTADFHVPLFHDTYPGNRNDVTTFDSVTKRLLARCKLLSAGAEHVTLVFDKGNNSQNNLDAVESAPLHFVGSLVPSHHQDLLTIPRERFVSLADHGIPGASAVRLTRTVFGHRRTVLVVFNENLLVAQSRTLLREIGKRQQWLRDLVAKLQAWRDRPQRGRKPTVDAVHKKINGWLKAQHMRQLFKAQVTERDGLPDLTYEFDQKAWQSLQDNLLGKTILFTDNDDWADADIVRAYRAQHHIEGAFRCMKDPHCIALRPQHHWTDQKVRVHVFTCVVALMLLSLLQRELNHHGIDCSFRHMTRLLAGIKEVIIATDSPAKATPTFQFALSRMSAEQRKLFDVLGLSRYTRIS